MKILLVEDDDAVRCISVEYLQELRHDVSEVTDAEKALVFLKASRFDAVMTDLSLPGMSGIKLAQIILEDYPGVPVIICSGNTALQVHQLMTGKMNAVLVLPKPYNLSDLERALSEAASQVEDPI
jgi:two-component system cell cycle response regulator CpdR